ncbi:conserved Plasmodium protein, unknown function [Plasmodium ovale wallikeri]|uniref:Uncharacterized protein n=1 Tax=Plasmodium ovale wallikeri TaxID=864142 RepID=A0A1A8ZJY6_PLAOA|nr:conserved Plasmodium protein, unknown function [Plasmodium ovale wallikeri]SBT44165.1 conserved Plasmodium protein, unknown function [Plasmodium ovale wallikeri]
MRGLNAETGNISMNHCFSRVKCNLLLICLTGSAVIAILIIAVFIQRATQIPLRGSPRMCDCFLDSSILPLTCIPLHSPKHNRTDVPTHTYTSLTAGIRRVKPGAGRNDDVEIGCPHSYGRCDNTCLGEMERGKN